MKLKKLRTKGIGQPFKAEASIDFEGLGEGLIALVGENGSGKSTLLELSGPGTIFREFVSYGESTAEHVIGGCRDASSELQFEMGGHDYTILLRSDPLANGGAGKTEMRLGRDGAWLAGPGVREYDAAIDSFMPSRDLFCASVFAAQGGEGSFFSMPKAKRKEMFVNMLGLGRLQEKCEAFTLAKNNAEARFMELRAKRIELEAKQAKKKEVQGRIISDEFRQSALIGKLMQLETASREAIKKHEGLASVAESYLKAKSHTVAMWTGEAATAYVAFKSASEATGKAYAALDSARVAAKQLEGANEEEELAMLEAGIGVAESEVEQNRQWVERVEPYAAEEAKALNKRSELRVKLEALRSQLSLAGVNLELDVCRACPLTERARNAAKEYEETELALSAYDSLPEQPSMELELAIARKTYAAAQAALMTKMGEAAKLRRAVEAQSVLRAEASRVAELEKQYADAVAAGREASQVESYASKQKAQAVEEQNQAEKNLADVRAELAKLQQGTEEQRKIQEELRQVELTIATAKGELSAIGNVEEDLANIEPQIEAAQADLTGYGLLAKGFGRDGIQALEIAAAGPGVTEIANELLATCYGPRFSLAIETTASKKDGGQKEVFDIRILDSENGRNAKQGSGGEMVIIEEALRLALAIYNAKISGYDLRTLWRDETAGALSPSNASRYVQMLRKAREIGGIHQVIFVAHSPEVWQQADTVLVVADGQVTKG